MKLKFKSPENSGAQYLDLEKSSGLNPKDLAAEVAVTAVRGFIADHAGSIDVTFCCFARDDYGIYGALLRA